MNRPVPGAAVVCLRGQEVLLIQRATPPNQGRWSFPGGKIELGETARAAAEREALEETGIPVRVLDVVDVYDALFPPYHYTVADFLAEPVGEASPVASGDVADVRWVPLAELAPYDITPEMECVLRRAVWLRDQRDAPHCLGDLRTQDTPSLRDQVRGLYVITDDTLVPGLGHLEITRAALAGGARIIQLRDKRRDAGALLPIAREMRAWCRAAGALFIVNDRADLALAADADGVHLGQTDLPVAETRRLLGPHRLIGISPENEEQVRRAEAEGADYLGVGAVYGSATKPDAGAAVGVEQIRRFRSITSLPIVAIGGITAERVPKVIAAGADSVAVISAVVAAHDVVEAARRFSSAFGE